MGHGRPAERGDGARPATVGQDDRGDDPRAAQRPGPAISTATKPDVMEATMRARAEIGEVWLFDPSGEHTELPHGRAPAVLVARRGREHLGCRR